MSNAITLKKLLTRLTVLKYFFILTVVSLPSALYCQLRIGSSKSEINFREGPGLSSEIKYTIDNSNLLVILPGQSQKGFVEVFDVESSSFGYVYESLIDITDTLYFRTQHYFERSDTTENGDLLIMLINRTGSKLFVWINKCIYHLDPYEKKELVMNKEDIVYFASAPGLYPVFGKEVLKKGFRYLWNFKL